MGNAGQGDGLSTANVSQVPDARRTSSSSSAQTASSLGAIPPSSKVAIPRHRAGTPPRHHRRVPRACASCHTRKIKCSGDTPVCRQCQDLDMKCVYPPALREKMKMQQQDLTKKLQECQNLLEEVEPLVPGSTANRIKDVLQRLDPEYISSDLSNGITVRSRTSSLVGMERPRSSQSSVGSVDALDQVEEDVNLTEESRATGHIGKSSEITWMQRLQKTADGRRKDSATIPETTQEGIMSEQTHDLNYHLDDLDITVSQPVHKYGVPPRLLADKLFETYLLVAHPHFPIINRPLFSDQYRTFYDTFAFPSNKWVAILNVIFAIAANYAQVAALDWREDAQDHRVYLTRARMLSMDGDELFRHPDLQQVQLEGLITFYLLSTDQIHRAWRISALAIRSAVSLGINLKNNSRDVTSISKEIRNRVWWSLFAIENRLGMMTGRPTSISVSMCSAPLPLPWDEAELQGTSAALLLNDPILRDKRIDVAMASSHVLGTLMGSSGDIEDIRVARSWLREQPASPGLCFLYSCDLTVVTQEVLDRVYAIRCSNRNWSYRRDTLAELQEEVDLWFSTLPPALDFTIIDDGDIALNEKMRLAFQYHGARMLLGRPCLCRHKSSQPDEKQEFNRAMALSALDSAAQIAHLIPDDYIFSSPHRNGPWWYLLHSVMQAVTIMILEISFGSIHMPEGENNLLQLTQKCVRWLRRTSENSIASRRAWQLCDKALRRLALSMGFQISDLSSHPYEQVKHPEKGYFGFSPIGSRKGSTVDFKEDDRLSGLDEVHITTPEFKAGVSGNFPSNQPAPVENGLGDNTSVYGPLGQEFIQTFFPELEIDRTTNFST
ncbi:Thiamine repressible regulatory protein [Penicillium rolfsii]|nr:Thiamine repressible regulatory protein [Penicillium rolfsii]